MTTLDQLDEHTPTRDRAHERVEAVTTIRGIGIALAAAITVWVGVVIAT